MLDLKKLAIDGYTEEQRKQFEATVGSATAILGSTTVKEYMALEKLRADVSTEPRSIPVPDMSHFHRMNDEARQREKRETEKMDLLRRSTVASEQAIADARRRESEAKADAVDAREEARIAKSHMRASIWLAFAALLATAWAYVLPRIEAL